MDQKRGVVPVLLTIFYETTDDLSFISSLGNRTICDGIVRLRSGWKIRVENGGREIKEGTGE